MRANISDRLFALVCGVSIALGIALATDASLLPAFLLGAGFVGLGQCIVDRRDP